MSEVKASWTNEDNFSIETTASDYISKAQAVAQTIAEIEALDIIEVCKALEQKIKNDYISQPPADVIEIVRCKDCKYYEWTANRVPEEQTWWCYKHNTEMGNNDYCSYGERKDDND